jgi:hypothetical protein
VKQYLKFFAQIAATVLAAAYPFLSDNTLSTDEIINLIILGLGAVGVLGAGNLPEGVWKYTKFFVSVATAVFLLLASVVTDGVTNAELVQLVIAGLGAAGVRQAPGPVVLPTGRHRAS